MTLDFVASGFVLICSATLREQKKRDYVLKRESELDIASKNARYKQSVSPKSHLEIFLVQYVIKELFDMIMLHVSLCVSTE
jgi:hypothetical protein